MVSYRNLNISLLNEKINYNWSAVRLIRQTGSKDGPSSNAAIKPGLKFNHSIKPIKLKDFVNKQRL